MIPSSRHPAVPASPNGGRRPRRVFRPGVESLEDRSVPAVAPAPITPPLPAAITAPTPPPAVFSPPVIDVWNPTTAPKTSLAVGELTAGGAEDFIVGQNWLNQMTVELQQSGALTVLEQYGGCTDPRAVQLADLTGSGLLDLIVADTGNNRLLVFLNQGNGEFAAPLAIATGLTPVAVTVADLNGDDLPDLAVANAGSNTVSLFFGQGTGSAWTLIAGPQLQVGDDPMDVKARDITGDGLPDLFVADAGSNDVYQLNNLGGGRFDDAHPLVYAVGQTPVAVWVGHFAGTGEFDLVTVNAGSDDLTLYANIATAGPGAARSSFSLSGAEPDASVMADFQQNGYDDLAVADYGTGTLTFLNGSSSGLVVSGTVLLTDMKHPTDIAVAPDGSGLYVVGNDSSVVESVEPPPVEQFASDVVVPMASGADAPADPANRSTASEESVELVSLAGSPNASVVVLTDAETGAVDEAVGNYARSPAAVEARLDGGGVDGLEVAAREDRFSGPYPQSELLRFVSGQDDLLQRQHDEAIQRTYDYEDAVDFGGRTSVPGPVGADRAIDVSRFWNVVGPAVGEGAGPRTSCELAREIARWLCDAGVRSCVEAPTNPSPLGATFAVPEGAEPLAPTAPLDVRTEPLSLTLPVAALAFVYGVAEPRWNRKSGAPRAAGAPPEIQP